MLDARQRAMERRPSTLSTAKRFADCLKDLKLGLTVKLVEEVQVDPKFFGSI